MNKHSTTVSRNKLSPYCKLCQDAGKPESVYRSHCVRDRVGKTTCPYLLSLMCRRCNGTGHTQSHCTASVRPNVAPIRSYSRTLAVAPKIPTKKHCVSNGFATLADLSSDEESDVSPQTHVVDKPNADAVALTPDEPKHWIKQSLSKWCDEESDNE